MRELIEELDEVLNLDPMLIHTHDVVFLHGLIARAKAALSECLEYKEALEWLGKYDCGLFPPVDEQDSWKVLTLKNAPLSFGPTPLSAIRNAMGKGE